MKIYYDCLIVSTEPARVKYEGRELAGVQLSAGAAVGAVGVTTWDAAAATWTFTAYLDASLRRRSELDSPGRVGWSNARRPGGWTCPRGIVPGERGMFHEDDTEQVTIAIPQEFFEICRIFRVSVDNALRAFIADACGIENNPNDQRADGYNRTSEKGTNAAEDYLNVAFSSRVDLRSLVVYRLPDDDLDEDDEECQLIQIKT